MTSWIGVSSVFADVVILLALGAAVSSRRVSRLVRPVLATLAFAAAWLTTAVFDAMQAPDWTIFVGAAVIVVSIVATTATLHLCTQAGEDGQSARLDRGDHGGGGPGRRRPNAPHHGGGGSDPSWWPEFERKLALYVAENQKEATRMLPATLDTEHAPCRPVGNLNSEEGASAAGRQSVSLAR